ncbi:MAG: VOC family protein [Planctomycetota bacterium]
MLALDRLLLRVQNVPAAAKFWAGTFGLETVRSDEQIALLKFKEGGEVLLHADADLPAEGVFIRVDSVKAMYDARAELRLTFTSPPTRIARGYRATIKDPFGNVLLILDRSVDEKAAEDARSSGALFPGVETPVAPKREALAKLYEEVGRTADDLPYTPHFEALHERYAQQFNDPQPTRQETWRHLLNCRKAGQLPKLGEDGEKAKARLKPPPVTEDARQLLADLLGTELTRRDRLPYSPRFDQINEAFNKAMHKRGQRPVSPHQLWRMIATLAK